MNKCIILFFGIVFSLFLNLSFPGIIPQGNDAAFFSYSSMTDWASPKIANDSSGKLYCVWFDNGVSTDENDVYFSYSQDNGQSWSQKVMVNNPDDSYLGLSSLDIAVSSDGIVYVVWYDPSDSPGRVYFAKSSNLGTDWTRYAIWRSEGYPDLNCDIDVDKITGKIFIGVSKPGTETDELFNIYCLYNANQGDINSWYYQTDGLNDVKWKAYGGDSYSGPVVKVSAYNNKVFVAWEEYRDGVVYIYCDYFSPGTSSFGTDIRVCSSITAAQNAPNLKVTSYGAPYISFLSGGAPFFVKGSADNPPVFGNPLNIINPGGGAVLAWTMELTPGNQPVFAFCIGKYVLSVPLTKTMILSSIDNGASFITNDLTSLDDIDEISFSFYSALSVQYIFPVFSRPSEAQLFIRRAILDEIPPTAPQNPAATPGDTCADLSWNASSDQNGIYYYYIQRKKTSGGNFSSSGISSSTSYRDPGLEAIEYQYQIIAVDNSGNNGAPSNIVSVTPTAPTNLPQTGMIVFQKDDSIYRMNSDTSGLQKIVNSGKTPNFKRDGSGIIYTFGDTVFSSNTDGLNPVTLAQDANIIETGIDCEGTPMTFSYIKKMHHTLVCAGDPAWTDTYDCFPSYFNNGSENYTFSVYNFCEDTAVSSNPQYIAFVSRAFHQVCFPLKDYQADVLFIVNKTTEAVSSYGGFVGELTGDFSSIDFAPNGTDIVFSWKNGDITNLWKASITAGTMKLANLVRLTDNAAGVYCENPQYSSDGNWIVYEKGNPAALYIIKTDSSNLRTLNTQGIHPSWHNGNPSANYESILWTLY